MTLPLAALLLCVLHVTLFAAAGMALSLAVGRRGPGQTAWITGLALTLVAAVTALSFGPWPTWRPLDVERRVLLTSRESLPAQGGLPTVIGPIGAVDAGPGEGVEAIAAPPAPPRGAVVLAAGAFRQTWGSIVAVVVLIGSALALTRLLMAWLMLRRYRRRSCPVVDEGVAQTVHALSRALAYSGPCQVAETSELAAPATIGWRRPLVLLPAVWRDWTPEQLRAVLAHELAHVARADYATWFMALAVRAVHFYHPLVRWLAARLHAAQELAADAVAAPLAGGRENYALALAALALQADAAPAPWPARSFLPSQASFLRRIQALRRGPDPLLAESRAPRRQWAAAVALLVVAVLILGLRGNSTRPKALAQEPPRANRETTVEQPPASAREAAYEQPPVRDDYSSPEQELFGPPVAVGPPNVSYLPGEAHGVVVLSRAAFGWQSPDWRRAVVACVKSRFKEFPIDNVVWLARPLDGQSSLALLTTDGALNWEDIARRTDPGVDVGSFAEGGRNAEGLAEVTKRIYTGSFGALYQVGPQEILIGAKEDVFAVLQNRARKGWFDWKRCLGPIAGPCAVAVDAAVAWDVLETLGFEFDEKSRTQLGRRLRTVVVTIEKLDLDRNPPPALWAFKLNYLSEADAEQSQQTFQLALNAKAVLAGRSLTIKDSGVTSPALFMRLLTAVRSSASFDSVKLIGLAWHGFHNDNGHFPLNISHDGKPLLSWRVAILPYLDEKELFDKFHLDEPWDSPHNSKLLEWMPSVYRAPDSDSPDDYDTAILSVSGEHMVLGRPEGTKLKDITDGLSQTIVLVETRTKIPWTKPEDLEINPEWNLSKPFAVGGFYADGFVTGFGDGSGHFISKAVDKELILRLMTIDRAEPVELP